MDTGFFWILLACAFYGAFHSVLASHTVKAFAERQVGTSAYRRFYRLFYVMVAVVTTPAVLALVPLLPDRAIYRIPSPWLYLALAVQALALLAMLAGVLQTGALDFLGIRQVFQTDPGSDLSDKLVISGLYRWVRHPLYTAAFLLLWLVPVMTWNLLALNIGFSAYLLIGTIFEERKLVAQFGSQYEQYRKKTPRILPGIKLT
jgi:protein-S-isoprenylcysteine O-methyltransferase Ste14